MIQLDKSVLDIIRNFSTFNPGLVVKPGNILMSRHTSAQMVCKAEFKSIQFDQEFAIFNLSKLLSVIAMFDTPYFDIRGDHLVVTDGSKRTATIRCASANLIVHPDYTKPTPQFTTDVDFDLTAVEYRNLIKAISALSSPEICIKGVDGKLLIGTYDSTNISADKLEIVVGETDKVFNMVYNASMVVFPNRDYHVNVSFKGFSEFKSVEDHNTLTYWCAGTTKSKIG